MTTPKSTNRIETDTQPGAAFELDLDRLDDNPFQPRTGIDAEKLAELAASIAQCGLLQSIAVRKSAAGRFQIVAGHRRVGAFRKLRQDATTDAAKNQYARIRAHVIDAVDNNQMAIAAYVENTQRHDLNPVEEAVALARIKELGGHATAKDLARVTGQNEQRVRRLLRLATAPAVVRDAVTNGVLVGGDAGRRERRRLDLIGALELVRLFDHFAKTGISAKQAQERTDRLARRALEDGWGTRRIVHHVETVLSDRAVESDEPTNSGAIIESRLAFRFDESRLANCNPDSLAALKRQLQQAIRCVDGYLAPGRASRAINAG